MKKDWQKVLVSSAYSAIGTITDKWVNRVSGSKVFIRVFNNQYVVVFVDKQEQSKLPKFIKRYFVNYEEAKTYVKTNVVR